MSQIHADDEYPDGASETDHVCFGCGCTDSYGCDEGCEWIHLLVDRAGRRRGLCSVCVTKARNVFKYLKKYGVAWAL